MAGRLDGRVAVVTGAGRGLGEAIAQRFGQVNYAASKAGVVGLTRSLVLEVARAGVTVNAIAPGYTATAMTGAMPPEVLERVAVSVPLGRLG